MMKEEKGNIEQMSERLFTTFEREKVPLPKKQKTRYGAKSVSK